MSLRRLIARPKENDYFFPDIVLRVEQTGNLIKTVKRGKEWSYIIMGFVVLFLCFTLLWKAKLTDDTGHFFDKNNSNAMRGFWCFIVILVHTPVVYQNTIQDIMGSFAYVGVTFFFMASGFGLTINKISSRDVEITGALMFLLCRNTVEFITMTYTGSKS